MKKYNYRPLLAALLVLAMIVSSFSINASAAEILESGKCGENGYEITWTFDSEYVLTISGTGRMSGTFEGSQFFPECYEMKKVQIEKGITHIGSCSFRYFSFLTSVTIPDTVTSIGEGAFSGLPNSISIYYEGTREQWTEIEIDRGNYGLETAIFHFLSDEAADKEESLHLSSSSPAKDGIISDVNSNYGISLVFDKTISVNPKWSAGSIYIKDYTTDKTVLEIDDKAFYSRNGFISDNTLSIPLALTGFGAGKYYIEIPSGFITAKNLSSDGKIVSFDGILNKNELCFTIASDACRLSELTTVDYLAFSHLAYSKNLHADMSVKEILSSVWDDKWESTEIYYRELFNHIANWRVDDITAKNNGFAAVSFVNDHNEVVIAFRGSEDISAMISGIKKYAFADFGSLGKAEKDAINDWIKNDFPMELGNKVGDQFFDPIEFYDDIANREWIKEVHVTGHSLGGAWADVVSAYSGCKGVSFNAVSALDVAYDYAPGLMAREFSGVDNWNFWDQANEYDILAGVYEEISLSQTPIKPYVKRASTYGMLNIGNNHFMKSMVTKDSAGKVSMTDGIEVKADKAVSNMMQYYSRFLNLGTTNNDTFAGIVLDAAWTMYGGDGNDILLAGISGDVLVGGSGNDILSGNRGSDVYIYCKGDGKDTVYDIAGNDELWLYGFTSSDDIRIACEGDSEYIDVYCNEELILNIYREKRERKSSKTNMFTVVVEKDGEKTPYDISNYFKHSKYGAHMLVCCPVGIQIVDASGNVVFVVEDGKTGSYYTDYGEFHVFEEENGEYGKTLNLIEGYTAVIVGEDEGTMDITVHNVEEGKLSAAQTLTDVPVSANTVATVEADGNNGLTLNVDKNGDGKVDEKLEFNNSVQRIYGETRYDTAFEAANELRDRLGVVKFDTIVVASGTEFADALSGSYLAAVKDAPILLVRNNKTTMQQVKDYIKANLKSGGTVYLLGGEKAVPTAMETGLEGFTVKRLGGNTRYDTNLLILKEAGVGDKDVLICTGKGFADSLSASAAGLPILLVKDSLTDAQKEFLKGTSGKKYIIGGTTAVNTRIETALKTYGTVTRLGGSTRYETSVLVAKTFFENPTAMVVAYAQNFPDGLSGGPLAYALKAPLILTANGKDAAAAKYAKELGIKDGFVLGGPTLISDKTAKNIFSTDTIK